MRINSTTVSGFGIMSMAGYGATAWNVGSAPIKIASRASHNKKSLTHSAQKVRSEKSTAQASVASYYVSKAPKLCSALDMALGAILIVCTLMMGF